MPYCLTTIRHPAILNDLYDNIRKHGHLNEVKVWVVGDRRLLPAPEYWHMKYLRKVWKLFILIF